MISDPTAGDATMNTPWKPELRTPADRVKALRGPGRPGPTEDAPAWHLQAAEEAMDACRWDNARAALERARENLPADAPEAEEACFVGLRLAVGTVDPGSMIAEIAALAARRGPNDDVWVRRVRTMLDQATHLPASMRHRLPAILAKVVGAPRPQPDESVDVTATALPPLPGDDEPWPVGETAKGVAETTWPPPMPTVDPFLTARPNRSPPPSDEPDEVAVLAFDDSPQQEAPPPFSGRVVVEETIDLTDTDQLRERMVEEMLAGVTDDEAHQLFATAATFLNNGAPDSAERLFSATMRAPDLRVAACEGRMQALVQGGRCADAVTTGLRATRIFVREGDAVLGIVYWLGVAAQSEDNPEVASACFRRVATSGHAARFPDLPDRIASLRR